MDKNTEIIGGFEYIKKYTKRGVEYWQARPLMALLGYSDWRNFVSVMDKAMASLDAQKVKVNHHFVETTKMVEIGSGAKRESDDYFLSRYACYLIAMNGDPTKPEIAAAQQYFALKTREQELTQQYLNAEQRFKIRNRIREANKHLASTAKASGVIEYGLFQHAGYTGLYGMSAVDVKRRKEIPRKEDLLDCVGRLELSANEFRINLTEEALKKDNVRTEIAARDTHNRIGKRVRKTMHDETGLLPENLPAEPSLKKLALVQRKAIKASRPSLNEDSN